jgi:lipopolysaccharide biosynthesis glycosyltransferase
VVGEHRLSCQDHGYEFGGYFNSGIMVVDLKQWRRSDLLERGRRFATENPGRLRHWDQDVLNQSNPAIIHFAGPGPIKPWNAQCKHPLKEKYLEAKAKTPWAETPLDDMPPSPWLHAMNDIVFQTKCFVRRILIGGKQE